MKELVTVFAACAIAGMAAAVDSNVVGYTTKPLTANQKVISGAQFVEVGEEGLELSSIKLENVIADGGASIQWWNGSKYESAAWLDIYFSGLDGWGDENTAEAVNHMFAAGEGFWIVMPGGVSGATVTQAGEVTLSNSLSYNFGLEANKKCMVINPLPTLLGLSDIKLVNVVADGGASIQWWNGSKYESAAWLDIDFSGLDGWGDENTAEAVNHTFAVNDGFWIVMPGGISGAQVQIANKVQL